MTTRGKIILTLLILGVVGFGLWKWRDRFTPSGSSPSGSNRPAASGTQPSGDTAQAAELVDTQTEVPPLAPPAAYQPKDNTLDLELSEYAGYAGLIVANGGL